MPVEARENRMMVGLAWVVTAALAIIPLAVTPDLIDRYRVLKETIARAEGILGAVLLVAAAAFAGTRRFHEMLRVRAVAVIVATGVAWAVVTTLASTHRAHSVDSLVTMITSALVFVTAWYAAPRVSLVVLDILVPVVAANVTLVTLQEYGRYQPFYFEPNMPPHLGATGLIDNPNIVGSYMSLVAVTFAAALVAVRGWRRALYAAGALCAIAGVLVSQTRTAFIALLAGLLLLAIRGSARRAVAVVVVVAALFGIGVAMQNPAVMSILALPQRARTESLEIVTSGRAAPVAAGLEMARERPITGVGPGAFKFHYMPYKSDLVQRFPDVLRGTTPTNFGEVHNDHVQLLAETGVPGYLLFLASIAVFVRAVRGSASDDPRARVARAMAVPLAGALLVLCLAQFPLYVAVTRHLLVTMAGLLIGWSRRWD